MTKMEAEGVTVDVCAGGCGGIWFDWFELTHLDEAEESAGEKFLEVDRDPTLQVDLTKLDDEGLGRSRSAAGTPHAVLVRRIRYEAKREGRDFCPGPRCCFREG
jgi:Zn-finger nucleic acid-binding protein